MNLAAASAPVPAGRLASWISLAVLGAGVAWTVVHLPVSISIPILLGGFAAAIWLVFPDSAVYALALSSPFLLSHDLGTLRGVRVQDAILIALAVSALTSVLSNSKRIHRLQTPLLKTLMGLWIFLLVWSTLAFLTGSENQWLLRDPARNAWYVYRGIWRDLLPFPLVAYCLNDRRAAHRLISAILLTGTAIAAAGIWEAQITQANPIGPLGHKNAFAGFLVLIVPFAVARLDAAEGWRARLMYTGVLLVMLRALWLTGSRGGFVALLGSFLVLSLCVRRKRLVAAAAVAVVAVSVLAVARGDLLERPMVQRFLTLRQPQEEGNLRWRYEQWRIFFGGVSEDPWLGTGSDVMEFLGADDRAPTAHNGYLALAIRSGIPLCLAWLLVAGVAGKAAIGALSAEGSPTSRAFWIGVIGFLAALLIHNCVEATILIPQVQSFIWMILGAAAVWALPPGNAVLLEAEQR